MKKIDNAGDWNTPISDSSLNSQERVDLYFLGHVRKILPINAVLLFIHKRKFTSQKTRVRAIVMYNTICSSYHLLILVNERNQQITIKMN